MRDASRNELVQQVAEFVDHFTEGSVWESTPQEAAEHIVDDIAVPFFDALPGKQRTAAIGAGSPAWTSDTDKLRAIAVRLYSYEHGHEPPALWGVDPYLSGPETPLWPQYLERAREMVRLASAVVLEWYYQKGLLK